MTHNRLHLVRFETNIQTEVREGDPPFVGTHNPASPSPLLMSLSPHFPSTLYNAISDRIGLNTPTTLSWWAHPTTVKTPYVATEERPPDTNAMKLSGSLGGTPAFSASKTPFRHGYSVLSSCHSPPDTFLVVPCVTICRSQSHSSIHSVAVSSEMLIRVVQSLWGSWPPRQEEKHPRDNFFQSSTKARSPASRQLRMNTYGFVSLTGQAGSRLHY